MTFPVSALAAMALLAAAPAFASEPAAVSLTFETGAETGAVLVSLYDNEAAWSGGEPVRQARIDVAAGARSVEFRNLPAGDYAARAFHDLDGDGEMKFNPFGMPTEPYAFSNNARGNMGPADWKQAHFTVSGPTAQTISIR